MNMLKIGNINNKKGYSITQHGTDKLAYILNTEYDSKGTSLHLNIYTSSGSSFSKVKKLKIDVPYRLFRGYSDYKSEYKEKAIKCLHFNPGIDSDGLVEDSFNPSYIEFNLFRTDLPNDTNAFDYQSSMCIKSDGIIDYIYIAVCSEIEKTYEITKNKYISSQCIILKYTFNTTDLSSLTSIPVEWAYPIENNTSFDENNNKLGKINNFETSYPEDLWNYNFLSYASHYDVNKYIPISFFRSYHNYCDIALKDYQTLVAMYTYVDEENSDIKQKIALSKYTFDGSSEFYTKDKENILQNYDNSTTIEDCHVEIDSDKLVVLYNGFDSSDNTFSYIAIRNLSKLQVSSINHFVYIPINIKSTDIDIYDNKLYISYYYLKDSKYYIKESDSDISSLSFSYKHSIKAFNNFTTKLASSEINIPKFNQRIDNETDFNYILRLDVGSQDQTATRWLYDSEKVDRIYPNAIYLLKNNSLSINLIEHPIGPDPKLVYVNNNEYFKSIDNAIFPYQTPDGSDDNYPLYLNRDVNFNRTIKSIAYLEAHDFSLGNTCTPKYWANPAFGYTEDTSNVKRGINVIFEIENCSGIYSKKDISNAWDASLGGVEVDTSKCYFSFKYGGDKDTYEDTLNTWSGGYQAYFEQTFDVSLKDENGSSLIYECDDVKPIKCTAWAYGNTGLFNLNIPVECDFSDYEYKDPDFILENCELSLSVKDYIGNELDSETYIVDIDPPNANGTITTPDYKIVDDVIFTMEREARQNYSDYTEIHNVERHLRYIREEEWESDNSEGSYGKSNSTSSDTKIVRISDLDRGDYCYYTYEPKLAGIKPASENIVETTKFVTNVKGHKYYLDNVELYLGVSGSYGNDIIDQISANDPLIYVANNSTADIKVTFDVGHEDWLDHSDDDRSDDINTYPGISGIYITALDADTYGSQNWPQYRLSLLQEFQFTPYDNKETYPNVNVNSMVKNLYTLGSSNASGLYLDSTDVSLASQDMTLTITEGGKYRIYIEVEDEFGQFSTWCVTNKSNNYKFPINE